MTKDLSKYKKNTKKSFSTKMKNDKGLTILQVLVVVGIIAILAGIALIQFRNALNKAKVNKAEAEIEMMGRAIEQIEEDTGDYIESLEQLDDTTSPDASFSPWWGPYVSSLPENTEDPWNTSYAYFFWVTAQEGQKWFQVGNFPPGPKGEGWEKGEKKGWGDASLPPGLWAKLGGDEDDVSERGFLLMSVGPDKEIGTDDDIEYGKY